jgi:hypothetical protein
MKCSFCDAPLVCRECRRTYRPSSEAEYQANFEPETPVYCPHCEKLLVCNACGVPCGPVEDED